MSWFKVEMSKQDVAAGKAINLQEEFTKVFDRSGAPTKAGMFNSLDVKTNEYFFSPGAVEIAKPLIERFGGRSCDAPKKSTLASIVTNCDAMVVPFAAEE